MIGALAHRLEEYTALNAADRAELTRLARQSSRIIQPRRDLIREGDAPRCVYLILDGWAFHYRTLADGRRQIVDFAIPGDLCDLNLFILDRMDHSVGALTRLRVAEIGREDLQDVVTKFPNITTALWWQELRRQGLIVLERQKLTIPDMMSLQTAGLFNPEYLHHRRLNRHTDDERRADSQMERAS